MQVDLQVEVGEGLPAEQVQRLAQQLGANRGRGPGRVGHEGLEAGDVVAILRTQVELVRRGLRLDPLGAEVATERRDHPLERCSCRGRRRLAPDRVEQLLDPDRTRVPEEQQAQHGARAGGTA